MKQWNRQLIWFCTANFLSFYAFDSRATAPWLLSLQYDGHWTHHLAYKTSVGYFLQLSRNTTVVGSILTTPHAAHSPRRPYQHLITPPPPQLPGAEADEATATSCCRSQNLFNQKAWPNHSGPATSEKPLSLLPCFHSSSKTYQKIKKPKDSGGAQAQWCPLLSSATRVLSWEVQQWGPRFLELGYVLEAAWLRLVPRDLSQAGSPLSWLL